MFEDLRVRAGECRLRHRRGCPPRRSVRTSVARRHPQRAADRWIGRNSPDASEPHSAASGSISSRVSGSRTSPIGNQHQRLQERVRMPEADICAPVDERHPQGSEDQGQLPAEQGQHQYGDRKADEPAQPQKALGAPEARPEQPADAAQKPAPAPTAQVPARRRRAASGRSPPRRPRSPGSCRPAANSIGITSGVTRSPRHRLQTVTSAMNQIVPSGSPSSR